MDSDSELSINDQISIIQMLDSHDRETIRLALSIVDKYPRPKIMINRSTAVGSIDNRSIVMCFSFQQWVRQAASVELLFQRNPDDYTKENIEMLKRLQKY